MPNPIVRDSLATSIGDQVHYSYYRGTSAADRQSSLILCLHPGWDGQLPSLHYGESFLSTVFIPGLAKTGATIVSPDCPDAAWNNPKSHLAILELIDHLSECFSVDQPRISLVGFSAGGWGAWYMLLEDARRFSSAIMLATLPVIDPVDRYAENLMKYEELLTRRTQEWLAKLPDLPIYMIHSRDDELLPYSHALRAHQALIGDDRHVELHTIEGVGHFDSEGYIEPLQASVPWLIDTWSSSKPI